MVLGLVRNFKFVLILQAKKTTTYSEKKMFNIEIRNISQHVLRIFCCL